MPGPRIAVDLNGVDPDRPRACGRYALAVAAALRDSPGEHEVIVWGPGDQPADADVVVALGGRPRLHLQAPVVAAVYDLAYLLAPRTVPRLVRMRAGFDTAWLTRRAAHLLAPSLGVAHALRTYLRVSESRLTVVPPVGSGWRRAPRADVEAAKREIGVADGYVLALDSHPKVPDVDVVTYRDGELPPARLHALLSGAVAWIAPARFAGCSIGALEAMACGAPPLVGSGTALAEVVGAAGVVIAPDDDEGWAAAIRAVVHDREQRTRLAAIGVQAARRLSPAAAVPRILQAAAAAAAAGDR